jgi:probable blue pigment (indigoidine) exporter
VIGAIQPLLVMLLAWCVDRQRSPWLAVFSALAGILGMAMLLLSPHTVLDPLGIGAAFLGAISMALGTWLSAAGRSPADRRVDRLAAGDRRWCWRPWR